MRVRNHLLGLAGLLAAAGVAAANPPGDAVRPQVDGREPTPIARDYYEPEAAVAGFSAVASFPMKSLPRNAEDGAIPLGDFASGFRNAVLNYMTVPLGTVPIGD